MPAPKLKLVIDARTKTEIERLQELTEEELCAEYLSVKADLERLTLLQDLKKEESRRRAYKAFKKGHVLDGGTHTGKYVPSKAADRVDAAKLLELGVSAKIVKKATIEGEPYSYCLWTEKKEVRVARKRAEASDREARRSARHR